MKARIRDASELLARHPAVDEVAPFGEMLRIAVRGGVDPIELARRTLDAAGVPHGAVQETRATVEDAFVSMVHEDERMAKEAA